MSFETDSFAACETLVRKWAPLMMRVGEDLRPKQDRLGRIVGRYVPPTTANDRQRMKRLRAGGMTIWEVARACGVTWRTAWKHSKPNRP